MGSTGSVLSVEAVLEQPLCCLCEWCSMTLLVYLYQVFGGLYLCKPVVCVDIRRVHIALCVCVSTGVSAVTSSLTDIEELQPVTSPPL